MTPAGANGTGSLGTGDGSGRTGGPGRAFPQLPGAGEHMTATKISHLHRTRHRNPPSVGHTGASPELATRTTSHADSGRKVREDAHEGTVNSRIGGGRRGPRRTPAPRPPRSRETTPSRQRPPRSAGPSCSPHDLRPERRVTRSSGSPAQPGPETSGPPPRRRRRPERRTLHRRVHLGTYTVTTTCGDGSSGGSAQVHRHADRRRAGHAAAAGRTPACWPRAARWPPQPSPMGVRADPPPAPGRRRRLSGTTRPIPCAEGARAGADRRGRRATSDGGARCRRSATPSAAVAGPRTAAVVADRPGRDRGRAGRCRPGHPAVRPPQPGTRAPRRTRRLARARAPRSRPVPDRHPGIGVDAEIIPVGTDRRRRLEVPPLDEPELAGWYRRGASPGEAGNAVLVGARRLGRPARPSSSTSAGFGPATSSRSPGPTAGGRRSPWTCRGVPEGAVPHRAGVRRGRGGPAAADHLRRPVQPPHRQLPRRHRRLRHRHALTAPTAHVPYGRPSVSRRGGGARWTGRRYGRGGAHGSPACSGGCSAGRPRRPRQRPGGPTRTRWSTAPSTSTDAGSRAAALRRRVRGGRRSRRRVRLARPARADASGVRRRSAAIFGLDELRVEQALTDGHRPKIERYGDVTLLVLRTAALRRARRADRDLRGGRDRRRDGVHRRRGS